MVCLDIAYSFESRRFPGDSSHQNNGSGLYRLDLFDQMRHPVPNLFFSRLSVMRGSLLNHAGDIQLFPVDTVFRENGIEIFPRTTNERPTCISFFFPRILPDEHYPGITLTFGVNTGVIRVNLTAQLTLISV